MEEDHNADAISPGFESEMDVLKKYCDTETRRYSVSHNEIIKIFQQRVKQKKHTTTINLSTTIY